MAINFLADDVCFYAIGLCRCCGDAVISVPEFWRRYCILRTIARFAITTNLYNHYHFVYFHYEIIVKLVNKPDRVIQRCFPYVLLH